MDEIGGECWIRVRRKLGLCKLQFFIDDLAINKDIRSPIELDPNNGKAYRRRRAEHA